MVAESAPGSATPRLPPGRQKVRNVAPSVGDDGPRPSDSPPRPTMTRRSAALLLAAVGACASPGKSARPVDVFWPTEASFQHLERAHARWMQHFTQHDVSPRRAFDEVLEELSLARASDRRIALFPGLEGRVHVDAADAAAVAGDARGFEEHMEAARQAYRDARDLSDDWIPAHLGLAQIARRDQRWEDAEEHWVHARDAAARAMGPIERERTLGELLFGRKRPKGPDALSPYPTEKERRALLLDQLAEAELWSFNQPAGAELGVGADGLKGTDLLRRTRDRLALERAYLRLARDLADGQDRRSSFADFVATIDRDVLAREGDLIEAYQARAQGRQEVGDALGAVSDLEHLVAHPMLAGNAELRTQLAGLRAGLDLEAAERAAGTWMREEVPDALQDAIGRLDRFFDRGALDPELLTRGTLLYVDLMGGYARRNPDHAAEARGYARQRIDLTLRALPGDDLHRPTLEEARRRLQD